MDIARPVSHRGITEDSSLLRCYTDVSMVRNSFMLMVKQSKSTVLVVLYPEDDRIMIIIIVGKLLPVHRAYHLRRPEISYGYVTFNSET